MERGAIGWSHGLVGQRSEEQTSELQSLRHLVCRLLLEKKKKPKIVTLRVTSVCSARRFCCVGAAARAPLLGSLSMMLHSLAMMCFFFLFFFFLNDPAPPEIYPFSLHDALPIYLGDQWSHYCILGLEGETLAEGQLRTTQE